MLLEEGGPVKTPNDTYCLAAPAGSRDRHAHEMRSLTLGSSRTRVLRE